MARIDMNGVTLVFEGVPLAHPPGGTLGGASGSLVVAGRGIMHRNTVTVAGKSFENSYADGVNTMTFEGYTLILREAGGKVVVGTQELDLGGGKKTIVITKEGIARIREE